jgi:hypothetical protein
MNLEDGHPGSACRSGCALRRPEVLAEVLARGFERNGIAPERMRLWMTRVSVNERSLKVCRRRRCATCPIVVTSEQRVV